MQLIKPLQGGERRYCGFLEQQPLASQGAQESTSTSRRRRRWILRLLGKFKRRRASLQPPLEHAGCKVIIPLPRESAKARVILGRKFDAMISRLDKPLPFFRTHQLVSSSFPRCLLPSPLPGGRFPKLLRGAKYEWRPPLARNARDSASPQAPILEGGICRCRLSSSTVGGGEPHNSQVPCERGCLHPCPTRLTSRILCQLAGWCGLLPLNKPVRCA